MWYFTNSSRQICSNFCLNIRAINFQQLEYPFKALLILLFLSLFCICYILFFIYNFFLFIYFLCTARALHHILEYRNHQVPWPSVKQPITGLLDHIIKRMNEASGIYQMFVVLGDVIILHGYDQKFHTGLILLIFFSFFWLNINVVKFMSTA